MLYFLLLVQIAILLLILFKINQCDSLIDLLSYDTNCPAFPKNVMAKVYGYLRKHNPLFESGAYVKTFIKMQELNHEVATGELTFNQAQSAFDNWIAKMTSKDEWSSDKDFNIKDFFAWKEQYVDKW